MFAIKHNVSLPPLRSPRIKALLCFLNSVVYSQKSFMPMSKQKSAQVTPQITESQFGWNGDVGQICFQVSWISANCPMV